jgi:CelD/BcsL family acetyltransferase involved in cellulose biosynthesis
MGESQQLGSTSRAEWIREPGRFAAIAPAWDRLAAQARAPFLFHGWLAAWWQAFGGGPGPRICVLWDGDELAAGLALFMPRRRLLAMANEHTPVFQALVRRDADLAALGEAVLEAGLELEVGPIASDDPALEALLEGASRAGWASVVDDHSVSPVTATTGDFDAYRGERRRRWREVERRGRKLSREHAVVLDCVAPPVDLDRELADGLGLEAAGWKGAAGTAILADPDVARFYRSIARSYHEGGRLRLSRLVVDGRLAAFDLAVVHAGRYFLLKTAYDEALASFAPGLVLRRAVIERCFAQPLEAHEFLGTDMAWKRLFATGDHRLRVYRGYPRRPLSSLRYAYRRRVRPLLKRAYLATRGSP